MRSIDWDSILFSACFVSIIFAGIVYLDYSLRKCIEPTPQIEAVPEVKPERKPVIVYVATLGKACRPCVTLKAEIERVRRDGKLDGVEVVYVGPDSPQIKSIFGRVQGYPTVAITGNAPTLFATQIKSILLAVRIQNQALKFHE